jgi:hypothetical protein
MAKKAIRLYIGDDGEPRETDDPCDVDHGVEMPKHNIKLSPPKFALHKAAAYFTGATVMPAIGMWRPNGTDKPVVEASFVLEIITADVNGWENALSLADDLRQALGQEAVLAINSDVVDTALVEA